MMSILSARMESFTFQAPCFSGTLLLQSEPLDFSGLSLWKGVCEDNRSRIFVRRDGCLDVVLKGLGKLFALFMAFSHHNMRLDNGASLFI